VQPKPRQPLKSPQKSPQSLRQNYRPLPLECHQRPSPRSQLFLLHHTLPLRRMLLSHRIYRLGIPLLASRLLRQNLLCRALLRQRPRPRRLQDLLHHRLPQPLLRQRLRLLPRRQDLRPQQLRGPRLLRDNLLPRVLLMERRPEFARRSPVRNR